MHRHASVNRIYRLVWSHASSSWVPAAETSRGRKKGSCKTLLATALSLVAGFTEAGPLGGQVVGGSGQIGQSGALTTITQISPVLSLSWASFNIAPQETVDFVQPSSSAIAVNRITGTDGTQILGHLEANGQVYLVNPNGIVFGRGSQVNVGGLVASTLDANDASLGSAARTFSGTGSGSVTNQGTINATGDGSGGGYVALLGTHVANQGTIIAQLGTVALGAGSAATLTLQGDSLVHLQVDRSVLNSMAANGGLIRADGGQILMSAGAKDSLLASVVNNTGIIEARAVENHAGTITLLGGMDAGTVNVAGTLDASAPNGGNGGFIETSAANVEVANSAKITTAAAAGLTGSWLIDPHDFTVAASGGNITGAALSGELATTNETLQSSGGTAGGSGNVNVNDAVSWGADTTLTLIASNNVNVSASITATGNHAGVVINPNTGNGGDAASGVGALTFNQGAAVNLTGTSATASVAGVSYIIVNTLGVAADATTAPGTPSLQGMAATANLSKNYALGSNIDATATAGWNAGAGFTPIGNSSSAFQGAFTGLGHTISNLNINLGSKSNVGLFGVASSSSTIQNVGIIGGSVRGYRYIGDLAGQDAGSINNSYATGAVSSNYETLGYYPTGGLVGLSTGAISNSYATGSVFGCGEVGGLVGESDAPISNSYATGNVTSQVEASATGGLVGLNRSTITNSYATGAVNGANATGGLVGNNLGSIDTSHATGAVYAGGYSSPWAGGLVGTNGNTGSISRSYATGKVNGGGYGTAPGGLVGYNGGSISKSYATGMVTGGGGYGAPSSAGGLVGVNGGTIADSWAGGAVSGSNAGGLVGVNSVTISNSYSTGAVTGLSPGGLVGSNGGTVSNSFWDTTTSGVATSAGGTGMITSDMQLQANFTSATAANGYVNPNWDFASTWSINGQSYPLLTGGVTLIPLTITADNVSKIYNGSAFSGDSNGVTFSIPGAASDFTGTLTYTGTSQGDVNVGAGTFSITPGGLQQTTNEYIVTYVSGTLTMSPLALSATLATGSSVYGAPLAPGALTFTNAIGSGTVMATTVAVNTTGLTSSSGHLIAGTHSGIESVGTTLTGVDAGDYTFTGATGDYTVTPLALTGAIATGSSIYGSALMPGAVTLNTPIVGDVVTAGAVTVSTTNQTSTSGHLTAGTHTGSESVGSTLTGVDASNYTFAGATGDYIVTPLTLTGSIATGGSIYGSALTPGAVTLNTPIVGDAVTAGPVTVSTTNQTSTSGHLNAGTHTGIESVVNALTGADAGDYTFAGATGNYTVTPLALTGAIATGGSIYGSALTPGAVTLNIPISGDVVTADATVTVNTTNQTSTSGHLTAGTHTGIESVGGTLTGADAADYTFAGATGDYTVTPLALTGAIATGGSIYGSPLAPGAVTLTTPIVGDDVTAGAVTVSTTNQTSTSGHLTAGTHSGVESVGSTLIGVDASDYTFAGATGNYTVSPLSLTGAVAAGSSIYGATLTPGAVTLTNPIVGDVVTADATVTLSTTNQTSTSGHLTAGTHTGIESVIGTLTGADAGDYTFAGATGNYIVTPLAISVAATGANKIYDGTTLAAPTLSSTAVILGDQIAFADTAANFAGKNAGSGQTVTVSGITIGGADAADYVLNGATAMTTATISPASLTVSGVAVANKTYDGTTSAILTGGSIAGVIAGDAGSVALVDAGSFTTKNVGTGIAIAPAETLSGAGAGNYVVVQPTGLAANITPATLTYDATAASRTAGQSPAGLTGTLSGFVVGESQSIDSSGTLVWTTPANADSGAGRYAIDGAGLTATNYVFVEAPGNAAALTLIPAAVPPVVPPAMTLPPAALGAIAALQAMIQVSGDRPPERPATFADSVEFSGFVDSVEDTRRRIGKTSASLTIVSGGVRLPP